MEAPNTVAEERCHTLKINLWRLRLNFNPVVTLVSAILIWVFVLLCMVYPNKSSHVMTDVKAWITLNFTWLYIGSINAWLIFIIVVYFSKYGELKLGKDNDEPEFSDVTYFTMLFAAGIGVGFFYFGVAEPIYHYVPGMEYGNRYWGRYSENQRAQDAINVTIFHWGFHGWIVYVLVGLTLAFVSHRMGLPMTVRSCFYPLIGDWIYGYMGDVIDILSIVSTMFGICASLGAGAMTMNSGLQQLNENIEENKTNQTIIVWVITFFATMSVVSGLRLGIRRLSEICFSLGIFIMLIILFYGNTSYLLNLFVQSIGYYIQNVIQLGYHTDAYAQLDNAPDGKQSPDWMHNWTVSYWGWWISWSPFVGMFIAKISRGRTVRSFIRSTLGAPVLFGFLWFVIVGGSGINMEREAALNNITCLDSTGNLSAHHTDRQLVRLSCRNHSQMYFDLVQHYGFGVGKFLRIVSMVSILLYFVTSSDSGSLVIDCLSANGSPEPPVAQRIFWALTEGATATALLTTEGTHSIDAILAAAVSSGLPYTLVLSVMCVSIWMAFKSEYGDTNDENVFSVAFIEALCNPIRNCDRLPIALVAPWWPAGHAAGKLYNKHPWRYMIMMAVLFNSVVLFAILEAVEHGWVYVAIAMLFMFFAYVALLRSDMRERFSIPGNIVEDYLASIVYVPAVIQLHKHISIEEQQKKDDPVRSIVDANGSSSKEMTEEHGLFVKNPYLGNEWV